MRRADAVAVVWRHVEMLLWWLTLVVALAILGGCVTARPCACACSCDEAGMRLVRQLQGDNDRLRAQLDFWRNRP
jgi:hypothetical protein